MHSCLRESADVPVRGVWFWTAHLESLSATEVDELGVALDRAERARRAQFRFEHDRRRYIAARGLLRCLLGAILHQPASALVFEYGSQGKPMLAGDQLSPLRFNLSHSAGWAMFAIAHDREIGIDLESAARLARNEEELSRLAARVLSARELTTWQTLPNSAARRAAFLRAWTRKEAYAKATGQGIFDALSGLDVILDAAAPETSLILRSSPNPVGLTSNWLLHDLEAPEGFTAALAVEQRSDENLACGDEAVFAARDDA